MYACHVLQGGFQFHRGKGAGGKDTLAAVRVVPFFQVILDLLSPVGGIVDIYIWQRSVAAFRQSFVHKGIHDRQRPVCFPDSYMCYFHLIYFLYRIIALTVWRLTPYCFARLFWEAWPEEYLTRISSACPLVSLAFTLFSP